jgi:flagellar protein FlaG
MEIVPAVNKVAEVAVAGSFVGVELRRHTAGATQPVRTPDTQKTSTEDTQQAVAELSAAMEQFQITLRFSRDDETGTIVVQMIDQKSGEALQQIPTETSLRVAAVLNKLQGKLFSRRA